MSQSPSPAIRLLALDLDGTIVSGECGVTPRVRAAIRRVQAQGVVVTIATGRMFRSARRFARDLDSHRADHLLPRRAGARPRHR